MKRPYPRKYKIECGDIRGIVEARDEGAAFRALLKRAPENARLGRLARVIAYEKGLRTPWMYITPQALALLRFRDRVRLFV